MAAYVHSQGSPRRVHASAVALATGGGFAPATTLGATAATAAKPTTPASAAVTAAALPMSAASTAAYARQRHAADALVAAMRAAPDGWQRECFHGPTKALWIDPFRDFYRCPHTVEKVGSLADGGKWVCGVDALLQRPGCIVYSFGSNGDTSFEQAMLERTACSVWTFDPTLDEAAAARVGSVPGLNFTAVGLSDRDGTLEISGVPRPVRTLHSLMLERGHDWVDVLKIDVEGAEWPVLDTFVNAHTRLPVTQALIELHVNQPAHAIDTMAGLVDLGMRPFHVEENNYCSTCPCKLYEVAFMQVGEADGAPVVGPGVKV